MSWLAKLYDTYQQGIQLEQDPQYPLDRKSVV